MTLYPYQKQLFDRVVNELEDSKSVVLQLDTGGGKTHIAVELAKSVEGSGGVVWLICHRREIIAQTSRAFNAAGVEHGIVSSTGRRRSKRRVQVCSVATLIRRANELKAPDLIIWDECHHIAAPSWSSLKDRFPHAKHLGLTATPVRLDGCGLNQFFNALICGPTASDLIASGYLSQFKVFAPTVPDLSGVRISMGDYSVVDLSDRMGGEALIGDSIDHYRRIADGSRAIVFAVSVRTSKEVAERFNQAGIPAAHIDGATPLFVRDKAIAALAAGRIKVISNVEIFTEGFDLPAIDTVILMRPTRSLGLYRQMIGRGLRTYAGKQCATILDHSGLVYEHGLPTDNIDWTLDGLEVAPKARGSNLRRCPECNHIHSFASSCPSCGYEYKANDRTIDEVFGELHEFKESNKSPKFSVHETVRTLAFRLGKKPRNLRTSLLHHGFILGEDGSIDAEKAIEFLRSVQTSGNIAPVGSKPGEYESLADFGNRIGKNKTSVFKLKKHGLPSAANGWIHVEPALEWLDEYFSDAATAARYVRSKAVADGTYVKPEKVSKKVAFLGDTASVFAARVGLPEGRVSTLKARGLPQYDDGTIKVDEAIAWLATPRLKPGYGIPPEGYESLKAFCRRIGVSETGGGRSLKKRGIPVGVDGFISIEQGLEWVRGNGVNRRLSGGSYYIEFPIAA